MHRSAAFWLIALSFVLITGVCAQTIDRGKPKKSTTGAVFRSLALPGWGQLYNESYVKAIAFFATESLIMIGVSRYHDQMKAANKADDFPREKLFRSSRNKNVWWLAGIKLLSLGDAYVDAQLFEIDISPSLTPEGSDGFQVGATFRF